VAEDNLTAVTGVPKGTFSKPIPDGKGGTIAPTGKTFAIDMATAGIWNSQGTMDEEFFFWDNKTFTPRWAWADSDAAPSSTELLSHRTFGIKDLDPERSVATPPRPPCSRGG
jgi:hypothetical protein